MCVCVVSFVRDRMPIRSFVRLSRSTTYDARTAFLPVPVSFYNIHTDFVALSLSSSRRGVCVCVCVLFHFNQMVGVVHCDVDLIRFVVDHCVSPFFVMFSFTFVSAAAACLLTFLVLTNNQHNSLVLRKSAYVEAPIVEGAHRDKQKAHKTEQENMRQRW